MISNLRALSLICGATLAGIAMVCHADATPRNGPAVNVTPEIIRQAVATPAPSIVLPSGGIVRDVDKEYPQQDIFRGTPKNLEHIPNGCAHNSASLCYDYRTGRAVYKPMRKLLPGIPGMTPYNLSVHRDKIVAQYTFR